MSKACTDDQTSKSGADYDVGRGKPPKHTRWKPGQSGNPKGRPKGSKNMGTYLKEVLSSQVVVRQNGKTRKMPFREAFVQSLAARALEGTVRDMTTMLGAIDKYLPEALEPERNLPQKITVRIVDSDGDGRMREYSREEWANREASTDASEDDDGAAADAAAGSAPPEGDGSSPAGAPDEDDDDWLN